MISKQEILDRARERNLRPNVVEKDYVLGWILTAIAADKKLSKQWVFKGGTCLKKCYYETYRFSEDLDFTLLDDSHLDETLLVKIFKRIAAWIYDNSGIEIPDQNISFKIYESNRGSVAGEGKIGYRGPLQQRGDLQRIKFDLTADEILVFEPVTQVSQSPYTDMPQEKNEILCYSFEELFAEKIRALGERLRPRDLYDVVFIFHNANPDRASVRRALREKCACKTIPPTTWAFIENHPKRAELEQEWENMLAHQLPSLPPYELYWRELPAVFQWLNEEIDKIPLTAIVAPSGPFIYPPWQPLGMRTPFLPGKSLEIIQFAAVNHLCVELGYGGTRRVIEPYSLRRTDEGHILLHAIKHPAGEHRAYRLDRIESAAVTNQPFTPKYAMEFTPTGVLTPPPKRHKPKRASTRRKTKKAGTPARYVIECPRCHKKFYRKKRDTKLRPHKTPDGVKCHATRGRLLAIRKI